MKEIKIIKRSRTEIKEVISQIQGKVQKYETKVNSGVELTHFEMFCYESDKKILENLNRYLDETSDEFVYTYGTTVVNNILPDVMKF